MAIPFQNYTFIGDKFATGGMNLKWSDINLDDNESPFMKNMLSTRRGSISSRNGYSKLNMTPVANYPVCLGLFEYLRSSGTQYVISAWDDTLYTGVGTLTAIPGVTGRSTSALDSFAVLNDVCVIVNGTDGNIYYNGTNAFDLGIAPPLAAPTNGPLVAGSIPAGTYQYVFTYVNAMGAESNPSAALTVVIPGGPNQNVPLTGLADSADAQVTFKNIYRTADGSNIFQYVAQIATGVTTYTDSAIDSALGVEVDYDNDVPPVWRYIASHKNRMFGVDATERNRLWISKEFQPGEVPLLNFIDVAKDDGDVITGLCSLFDQLVIFKTRSIYVLAGNNESDFAVQKAQSDSRIGCVAFRTITVLDNVAFFLSERGVYAFDGLRTKYLSEVIEPVFDRTFPDQSVRFNWAKMSISAAVGYKNGSRNWYILCMPTGSSTWNRYIWVYDYVQNIWFPFDNISVDATAIVTEQNEPRWYTARTGFMWRQDDTDNDGWIHEPSYSTSNANTNITLEDLTQAEVVSVATSGGAATLTDNIQTWVVNEHVGKQLYIRAGLGIGQVRTVLSNTVDTLTVAAWGVVPNATSQYTIGGWPINALDHVPVKIIDGVGVDQTRIIISNTSVDFTISVAWSTIPTTLSKYSIGYIEKEWHSKWFNYNQPEFSKRLNYLTVNADREGAYNIRVGLRFDFFTGDVNTFYQSLALTGADSVWDISIWDVDSWDQVSKAITRLAIEANRIHRYVQVIFANDEGNHPFTVNSFDLLYQLKGLRR